MMDLDVLLERSLGLADEGEWSAMADLLREHLSDFDDEAAVHCWLGVAERELGLEGVAYERFKRALSLDPEDPYVLATAGNGIAAFDDPDAMEALKAAALIAPDVTMTRMLYGAYLAREGFHEWALEQLLAARELDPDDPQVAYELGVAHALASQGDAAADALGDAVQLDPEDGWARLVFGLVLYEEGRLEEAVGELTEGARLRPDDLEAQLVAALAAGAAEMDGLAYEMLERGRMRAEEGDLALLSTAEEQIDAGPEASQDLLKEDVAPDLLRRRLLERP
jgi:tetratricopeptide (TPR) repeat protein